MRYQRRAVGRGNRCGSASPAASTGTGRRRRRYCRGGLVRDLGSGIGAFSVRLRTVVKRYRRHCRRFGNLRFLIALLRRTGRLCRPLSPLPQGTQKLRRRTRRRRLTIRGGSFWFGFADINQQAAANHHHKGNAEYDHNPFPVEESLFFRPVVYGLFFFWGRLILGIKSGRLFRIHRIFLL